MVDNTCKFPATSTEMFFSTVDQPGDLLGSFETSSNEIAPSTLEPFITHPPQVHNFAAEKQKQAEQEPLSSTQRQEEAAIRQRVLCIGLSCSVSVNTRWLQRHGNPEQPLCSSCRRSADRNWTVTALRELPFPYEVNNEYTYPLNMKVYTNMTHTSMRKAKCPSIKRTEFSIHIVPHTTQSYPCQYLAKFTMNI
jgi:hypothetical protein